MFDVYDVDFSLDGSSMTSRWTVFCRCGSEEEDDDPDHYGLLQQTNLQWVQFCQYSCEAGERSGPGNEMYILSRADAKIARRSNDAL